MYEGATFAKRHSKTSVEQRSSPTGGMKDFRQYLALKSGIKVEAFFFSTTTMAASTCGVVVGSC